jgi:hypothetical protein
MGFPKGASIPFGQVMRGVLWVSQSNGCAKIEIAANQQFRNRDDGANR